jgi:protoporphyrinogen oxidase
MMKIGIIGAGFTGLSAGFKLAKEGHDVTIFEANSVPGGLAVGFKDKNWKWNLEEHYHHLFKTDKFIKDLADEIEQEIVFVRPKTSTYYKGEINQIDSPLNLLKFKHLPIHDRIRTGSVLAYLKATNSWDLLEKVEVKKFLIKTMGENSWKVLWEPLMDKKFGKYSTTIPASWFWARVKSRTAILGYPKKGFKEFSNKLANAIEKKKGKIIYNTKVEKIERKKEKIFVYTSDKKIYEFDKVICTLPFNIFSKITKGLPKRFIKNTSSFKGIGATNLVLQLNRSFLSDGTYWLNINEKKFPFLCVVEHTNFMDTKNYGGQKIIYIGNYLSNDHPYFSFDEKQILDEYFEFLKELNKDFRKSWIEKARFFKAPFAQPIITKNYSKKIPPIKTEIEGLYLANIQQVYPWDRGTNYAVELGEKVANYIIKK